VSPVPVQARRFAPALAVALAACFATAEPASATTFAPKVSYATGAGPHTVAVGDLDKDGKPDVVTGNETASSVSILKGNGDGTLGAKSDVALAQAPRAVTIADVNKDGNPDILTANRNSGFTGNTVSVLLGSGGTSAASFTISTLTVGPGPQGIATGDLDKDSNLDIVTANAVSNTVSVLGGNGDGTFDPPVSYAAGSLPTGVQIADVDKDGLLDVAVSNLSSNDVRILKGTGGGILGAATPYAEGSAVWGLSVADLNGDTFPDIVSAPNMGSVNVRLNSGAGTFPTFTATSASGGTTGVTTGDVDADGDRDVVAAIGSVSVLHNNGSGGLSGAVTFAAGSVADNLTLGDLNGDGLLDVVTSDSGGSTTSVLLNTTPHSSLFKGDGNANDFYGLANGTWTGTPGYATDRIGNATSAFNFDGTNSVSASANIGAFGSADFTVSMWINATSQSGLSDLIQNRNGCGPAGFIFLLKDQSPYVGFATDADRALMPAVDVVDGTWHKLTFTRNGETAYLAVDGASVATATASGALVSGGTIHFSGSNCGEGPFVGAMDDVLLANGTAVPIVTTAAAVSGTVKQGTLLTGSATFSGTSPTTTYSWQRCDSAGNNCDTTVGINSTYTPDASDVGNVLKFTATSTNAAGSQSSSVKTAAVAALAPTVTSPAAISGGAVKGMTLTGSAAFSGATSTSYLWQRCDSAGNNCTTNLAATAAYTPVTADVGTRLKFTATGDNGGATTATSATTGVIAATLTVRYSGDNTPNDANGNFNGTWSGTAGYTTDRNNNASSAFNFNGSSSISASGSVGAFGSGDFTVSMWIKQPVGSSGQLAGTRVSCGGNTSGFDFRLSGGIPLFELWTNPSGYAGISASTRVDDGTWHQVSFTRASGIVSIAIDGVRKQSFSISDPLITGGPFKIGDGPCVGPSGDNTPRYSGAMDDVIVATGTAAPLVFTPAAVSGTVQQGSMLSGSAFFFGTSPTTTYSWERCDAAGNSCTTNVGTSSTYTPGASDVGNVLRFTATSTNGAGTSSSSIKTAAVAAPAPTVTTAAAIGGPQVKGGALTGSAAFSGATSTSYEWQRCDSAGNNCNTSLATTATYTPVTADVGNRLKFIATGANGGSTTPTSATTAVIGATLTTRYSGDNTPNDANGNFNGTWSGTPAYTTDRAGAASSAFDFNGTNSISASANAAAFGSNDWTASLWMKHAPSATWYELLTTQTNCPSSGIQIRTINGTPWIEAGFTGGYVAATGTSSVNDDTWHQLTATYDGIRLRMAVDGVMVGSTAVTGPLNAAGPLQIADGGCRGRDATQRFDGQMDDVTLINGAAAPLVATAASVSGTTTVGQQLTGSATFTSGTPTYAWTRCDAAGSNCNTTVAVTAAYTPTASDAGKVLRFTAGVTNAAGTRTTSASTAAIAPAAPTFDYKPNATDPRTSAQFNFSSTTAGVTFECKLDSAAYSACTSPSLVPVTNGSHTYSVRALAGTTPSSATSYTWTTDTSASLTLPFDGAGPQPTGTGGGTDTGITLTAGQAIKISASGTWNCGGLGCSSTPDGIGHDPGAPAPSIPALALMVRVGSGPWVTVGSGPTLVTGTGKLYWASNDSFTGDNANTGASITITIAPTTQSVAITAGPASTTSSLVTTGTSVRFAFTGTSGSTYECSYDNGSTWSACTSPDVHTYTTGTGAGRFRVRATDAGNKVVAIAPLWTVSSATTQPTPAISSADYARFSDDPTFTFSSAGATGFECSVDSGSFTACDSGDKTISLSSLSIGSHTLRVRAYDANGTASETATRTFVKASAASAPKPQILTSSMTADTAYNANTQAITGPEGGLRDMRGADFDAGGDLFLADFEPNKLHGFTPTGTSVSAFPVDAGAGPGPMDLEIDKDGAMWVLRWSGGASVLEKRTAAGAVSASYTLTGTSGISGLGSDPVTGILYLASTNGRIYRFDPNAASPTATQIALLATEPWDVAVETDGTLYVTGRTGHEITQISPTGDVLGSTTGVTAGPRHSQVTNGILYFATDDLTAEAWGTDGTQLITIPASVHGVGTGTWWAGADSAGRIYVDGYGGLKRLTVSTLDYAENDAAKAIDPELKLYDAATGLAASATVTLDGYVAGEDVLSGEGTYGDVEATISDDTVTLVGTGGRSGTASLSDFQDALRAIKYANTSDAPATSARTAQIELTDDAGETSTTFERPIAVTAANDKPSAGGDVNGRKPGTTDPAGIKVGATPTTPNVAIAPTTLTDADGATPTKIRITGVTGGTLKSGATCATTVTPPAELTLAGGAVNVCFTPSGIAAGSITYTVVDPDTGLATDDSPASTVTIALGNDAPAAGGDRPGQVVNGVQSTLSFSPTLTDLQGVAPTTAKITTIPSGLTLKRTDGTALAAGDNVALAAGLLRLQVLATGTTDRTVVYKIVDPADPTLLSDASNLAIDVRPALSIDSGPTAGSSTLSRTASFAFSGAGLGGHFECSLDGAIGVTCGSPRQLTGLAIGGHSITITAVDAEGDTMSQAIGWTVLNAKPLAGGNVAALKPGTSDPAGLKVGANPSAPNVAVKPTVLQDANGTAPTQLRITGVSGGTVKAGAACGTALSLPAAVTLVAGRADVCFSPSGITAGSITYTVVDPDTGLAGDDSAPSTVSIPLGNDAPSAGGDQMAQLIAGTAKTVTLAPTLADLQASLPVSARIVSIPPNFTLKRTDGTAVAAGNDVSLASGALKLVMTAATPADGTIRYQLLDAADPAVLSPTSDIAVDVLPALSVDSGPADGSSTTDTGATFTFSGAGAGGRYECALDGAAAAPCTSPHTLDKLGTGAHSLAVAAFDADGDTTTQSIGWTVTNDAPSAPGDRTVQVVTGTAKTVSLSPTLADQQGTVPTTARITGIPSNLTLKRTDGTAVATGDDVPLSGGELRLDLTAATPADGTIGYRVIDAVDPAVLATASTITVDVLPTLAIDSGPAEGSSTTDTTAAVGFSGSVGSGRFECALDGAAAEACTSPRQISGLGVGPHRLAVSAVDGDGDTVAKSLSWTVSAPPSEPKKEEPKTEPKTEPKPETKLAPGPTILSGPTAETGERDATFEFQVTPGSVAQCSLDGARFVWCASPAVYKGLDLGKHYFIVRQVSAEGVLSDITVAKWRIDVAFQPGDDGTNTKVVKGIVNPQVAPAGDDLVGVGCELNRGSLQQCEVDAYVATSAIRKNRKRRAVGHQRPDAILVGTGVVTLSERGHSSAVVDVKLNAEGMRLSKLHPEGLPLILDVVAQPFDTTQELRSFKQSTLRPPQMLVVPSHGMFAGDSAELSSSVKQWIKAVAKMLGGSRRVRCEGYSDTSGTAKRAKALGFQRAKAVCDALDDAGVTGRIGAVGIGSGNPRGDNDTKSGRRRNRRVEIRVWF
jgi:outer membrane protein OmpA-like peptidoglycan-associated protein